MKNSKNIKSKNKKDSHNVIARERSERSNLDSKHIESGRRESMCALGLAFMSIGAFGAFGGVFSPLFGADSKKNTKLDSKNIESNMPSL